MGALRSVEQSDDACSVVGRNQTVRLRTGSLSRRPKRSETKTQNALRRTLTFSEREAVILAHREFAENIAWKILKQWQIRQERDDIRSAAALALCAAAQTFDPSRSIAFSTLLFHHVRGVLLKQIAKSAKQQQIRDVAMQIFKDDADDAVDVVKPNHFRSPDAALFEDETRLQCQRALKTLIPLERQVIEAWMYEGKSVVDIARALGYSRGHVSRIKTCALSKLAQILRR